MGMACRRRCCGRRGGLLHSQEKETRPEVGGDMFTGFGTAPTNTSHPLDNDKTLITNNIITLVRAHQASNLPVDYAGLMTKAISVAAGPNDPEIAEMQALLSSLITSNPYAQTAAQEAAAEAALVPTS